jgi:hypothetical protein
MILNVLIEGKKQLLNVEILGSVQSTNSTLPHFQPNHENEKRYWSRKNRCWKDRFRRCETEEEKMLLGQKALTARGKRSITSRRSIKQEERCRLDCQRKAKLLCAAKQSRALPQCRGEASKQADKQSVSWRQNSQNSKMSVRET